MNIPKKTFNMPPCGTGLMLNIHDRLGQNCSACANAAEGRQAARQRVIMRLMTDDDVLWAEGIGLMPDPAFWTLILRKRDPHAWALAYREELKKAGVAEFF